MTIPASERCTHCRRGDDAAAKAQGAAEERKATVRLAREICAELLTLLRLKSLTPMEREGYASAESSMRLFAATLERGDHITKESNDE